MNRFLVWLSNYGPWGVTALRIAMGLIMTYHGWLKVSGDWATGIGGAGIPIPMVLGPVLSVVEFVGGIFLIFGIITRFVGVLFTIEFLIIVIYVRWIVFGQFGTFGKWELDLAMLGAALCLATNGAGPLSLGRIVRQLEA